MIIVSHIITKDQFAKAGINEAPKTYAEVLKMQKALKASGVDYPLAMSMNAEEKAATGLMWTAFQNGRSCME